MGEDAEQADPDVRESVDAFRRAGIAASDGLKTLYGWGHVWIDRRHILVQFTVVGTVWFAGNWTYNRIASPILTAATTFAEQFLSEVGPVVSFLQGNLVFASVQLLLFLIVIVVTQNQMQTRKLNTLESKLTIMFDEPREATDGGTPERRIPSDWTICGVVCGAIIGISFGPGGVLAGMYLGFWIGGKVDRRVYENDPLAPDLNQKARSEQ